MQLLRLTDARMSQRDRVFYHSRARAVAGALLILAGVLGLFLFGWLKSVWPAYVSAAFIFLCLVIFHQLILARFRSSNWLLRLNDDRMLIKFRSYLNDRFPQYDLTVMSLPFSEIRSAKLLREKQELKDYRGHSGTTTKIREFVELEVNSDCRQLTEELAKERERVFKGKAIPLARYGDFPVRVTEPNRIQIDWTVVPRAQTLLEILTRHTLVHPAEVSSKDFVNLEKLPREQQEARLRGLAESGDKIGAIVLARQLYSYDLTAAKQFVEELLDKPTTS
ncbi:MAG TPA: hypothetical protein VNT76_10080 [Candidatus Binatus sp.]|nr:hypothetical protein [Candidatus Binatus sp.]